MPSTLHDGLVSLFLDDPALIVDLIQGAYGVTVTSMSGRLLDRHATFERDGKEHLRVNPRHIDLVLVIEDPRHPDGGAVIIIEIQLDDDPIKRRHIAGYIGLVVDRHGLPVHLGTVTFQDRVSRKLANWHVGTALSIHAFVLDRKTVPRMTDLDQARKRPCAAVLSAAIHGHHGDLETVETALTMVQSLPLDKRQRYTATILAALPERRRAIYLGALPMERRRELSQLERRSGTYLFGVSEGKKTGLAQGRKEGRKEGRKRGLEAGIAKGRKQGLVQLVTSVLELRGFTPNRRQRAAIRAADLDTIERWAAQVREVESVDALLQAG